MCTQRRAKGVQACARESDYVITIEAVFSHTLGGIIKTQLNSTDHLIVASANGCLRSS